MNSINSTNAININNLLLNLTNGILQNNGVINSESNNSKGSFSEMLSMILGGKVEEQAIIADGPISRDDITNLMISSSEDDKLTEQTEIDYSSIMNILFSGVTQNPIYPAYQMGPTDSELHNMNFENTIIDLNPNIAEVNNSVDKYSNGDSNGYSIVGKKIYQQLPIINETVNNLSVNNLSDKNNRTFQQGYTLRNDLVTDKSYDKIDEIQSNVSNKITPLVENSIDNEKKLETTGSSLSKEILSTKLNENKNNNDKTNMDMDLSSNILENKTPIFTENNKIIEISDESSKIKDTILAQVEDKIIFMAKEKEGIQQVTMELNPKNLGKVNVKMSVEPEKITVEIMALDQKTSSILMSNAQELTRSLQNNFNINNGNVTVTVTENVLNQYNQSNLSYNQQHSPREQSYNSQSFYNNVKDLDEGNVITEMINLRNFKLNKVV